MLTKIGKGMETCHSRDLNYKTWGYVEIMTKKIPLNNWNERLFLKEGSFNGLEIVHKFCATYI